MTSPWIPRLGGFAVLFLVGTALLLLQLSVEANGLLFFLPSYTLVAIAALIAFATLRLRSAAGVFCVAATAAFAGWIGIRALSSPVAYVARADLYLMLAGLVVYGLTITALSGASTRITLIIALLLFGVLHVLVATVQFGIGHNFTVFSFLKDLRVGERARGFYENPDHLAGLLEIIGILGLSIAWWSRRPGWMKVLVGYLALVAYIGLALTASRGGYLSAAASLVIFAVLSVIALQAGGASLFRKYGAIGLIVLTAAVIGGWFLLQQSSALSRRVTEIVKVDQTRLDLWRASIDQWKLRPLIGTGSGTYLYYGREFRAERMQMDPIVVHNDYLNLLCEYGAIGLAVFLIFLFAHLRHASQTFARLGPKRLAAGTLPVSDRLALNIGALSATGAYIVHSMVDFNMHVPANAVLMAFVFGILADPGKSSASNEPSAKLSAIPQFATAAVAAVLLLQCVRLMPGEYYAERARLALDSEDPGAAVAEAKTALTWEKHNPNIYFYLGRAFGALADKKHQPVNRNSYYEAAVAAFEKARELAPLDGHYPLDIAYAYDAMGRYAEAEWMYGIARARDPRSEMMSNMYETHLEDWRKSGQTGVAGTGEPR